LDSLFFALGVAVLAFCAGVLGLKLHAWLPDKHAPDRSREMIGAMTGLLGLLLALVLGTLVALPIRYTRPKRRNSKRSPRARSSSIRLSNFLVRTRSRGARGSGRRSSRATKKFGVRIRPISREWT